MTKENQKKLRWNNLWTMENQKKLHVNNLYPSQWPADLKLKVARNHVMYLVEQAMEM